jgi:hypothetical protein
MLLLGWLLGWLFRVLKQEGLLLVLLIHGNHTVVIVSLYMLLVFRPPNLLACMVACLWVERPVIELPFPDVVF